MGEKGRERERNTYTCAAAIYYRKTRANTANSISHLA
uniref:Uncharacterized protein n=1 Tax=Setaria italica TaxID=4555 RepID=K3ZFS1_SETIT